MAENACYIVVVETRSKNLCCCPYCVKNSFTLLLKGQRQSGPPFPPYLVVVLVVAREARVEDEESRGGSLGAISVTVGHACILASSSSSSSPSLSVCSYILYFNGELESPILRWFVEHLN